MFATVSRVHFVATSIEQFINAAALQCPCWKYTFYRFFLQPVLCSIFSLPLVTERNCAIIRKACTSEVNTFIILWAISRLSAQRIENSCRPTKLNVTDKHDSCVTYAYRTVSSLPLRFIWYGKCAPVLSSRRWTPAKSVISSLWPSSKIDTPSLLSQPLKDLCLLSRILIGNDLLRKSDFTWNVERPYAKCRAPRLSRKDACNTPESPSF